MTKKCKICGVHKELWCFYKSPQTKDGRHVYCKPCDGVRRKANREKNYDRERSAWKNRYIKNRDRVNLYSRERNKKIKALVFHMYGGEEPSCACCGENKQVFLAIDHIGGGGSKQRKTIFGAKFYRWLVKNNFPTGFRVLCHNCNWATAFNRTCPHKEVV